MDTNKLKLMKKTGLAVLISMLAITMAFSQENTTALCSNGIDDDKDGFIDCYDPECAPSATNTACTGSFLGNNVVCQAKPTTFPQFVMQKKVGYTPLSGTTNHLNRSSIGDLIVDPTPGAKIVPEIVVLQITYDASGNGNNGKLNILNGQTGASIVSVSLGYDPFRDPLIANLGNIAKTATNPASKSTCGWVFVGDPGKYIRAYDCTGTLMWTSAQLSAQPITLGIADFDGDGKAEIYTRDIILAAESGIILSAGDGNDKSAAPVAVDILDASGNPIAPGGTGDNKLELVSGLNIYTVSLAASRAAGSATVTLKKPAPAKYLYWPSDGNTTTYTSVADYNQDGAVDIIATGQSNYDSIWTTTTTTKHGGTTTTTHTKTFKNAKAFFWDVYNNTLKIYGDSTYASVNVNSCPASSGKFYAHGWQNGLGRINIADTD